MSQERRTVYVAIPPDELKIEVIADPSPDQRRAALLVDGDEPSAVLSVTATPAILSYIAASIQVDAHQGEPRPKRPRLTALEGGRDHT
jgi:hypothetical protein